ncbi:antifungal protein ginkbilobin-2-like [Prunus yedoensis var. nudiflora]|uniref:Antifungal protein ginkbilobin-2-like n=1 Tax=Prunus yedoensis var. nudiflora TaxID=2094558 RepID=A0A315B3D2_PRUYE|nr:antifungal protein ginkbilobin-2-like [Prunus yedoensis var. nudiflora]PQQ20866.1 antifungal protein ginkbilobin-2-like [Prunus yedoensis var. nudiflora]
MAIHLMKIAATIIVVVFIGFFGVATSTANTNITSVLCNSGVYTAGDPFAVSLAYVLQELKTATSTHKNYDFTTYLLTLVHLHTGMLLVTKTSQPQIALLALVLQNRYARHMPKYDRGSSGAS